MSLIDAFVDSLVASGDYSPRSIRFYREQSRIAMDHLQGINPDADPRTLSEDDLRALVLFFRSRFTVSTQRNYLAGLRKLCEFCDNDVFSRMHIIYQTDTRPNVDWLSYTDALHLLSVPMPPLESLVVCLELEHGLRRVEVIRLRTEDVHLQDGYLTVRGKGRIGGKLRNVPFHPDFRSIYNRWMKERKQIIRRTTEGRTDRVLCYAQGGKLRQYEELKGGAIDNRLHKVSKTTGIQFSNHTLRRTFGRELFRSGVDIVVIANILGHVSTVQTMKYLGLDLEDMTAAMSKMRLRKD